MRKKIDIDEFKKYVEDNYSLKEIAHIYATILRANYELINMHKNCNFHSFKLEKINDFMIEYNDKYIMHIDENDYILTETEMDKMVSYIYKYFQNKYPINYDYKLINPIYFSLFFYDLLDKILYIKYDEINIADIRLLRYKSTPVKIEESERYKAILDNGYKMYSPFRSNLISETPEQRVKSILDSIKKNGYAYNGEYAVFYNDEPYIRDGQHRVSALKYLYGDINIKILRVYLKDNYFYE